MNRGNEKLDNPVWYSLSEAHKRFDIGFDHIKFYHPDYCPFGGSRANKNFSVYLEHYSAMTDNFFIVGERPGIPNSLKLKNELVCEQMILHEKITTDICEDIVKLNDQQANDVFRLVNLVQPGYFRQKTFLLGDYYGLFKNNELVAVTGERMKMNEYTEVSAVVTHPDHTGRGYAKQLVTHAANNVFDQNKTPYLHVAENNVTAINLYEKLGFKKRRKISFWNLVKTDSVSILGLNHIGRSKAK